MGGFIFAAVGLVVLTVLLLLRPWQRENTEQAASAREINARICRDQLAELDRDLAAGTLAPADHAQARDELQRRLLDDNALGDMPPVHHRRQQQTVLAIALALPLAGTGLYALLGEPAALLPQAGAASDAGHAVTAAEIDQMVAGLAARLEKNPADAKGWAMLARSYRALGRHDEARVAYTRIGDMLDQDPDLLAEYADVLATLAGGELEGAPLQRVGQALKLDPAHPMALSLAATAAYKRKDFGQAAVHWQRLLAQVPPDSDDAKWLRKTLAEIGAPVDATPGTTMAAAAPEARPAASAAGGRTVSGVVSLAPALQPTVRPTDTVFVFARATDGSRVPLAVQRARVADLPLRFTLDDSMAMNPQHRLSDAKQVRIEARVSRQGDATPASGDLVGASAAVVPGSGPVQLTIDSVRP